MLLVGNNTTPRHLNSLLGDLDITNEELAEAVGTTPRTVYRWLQGESPIPRSVVALLEMLQAPANRATYWRDG